jgi:hypothetical protein
MARVCSQCKAYDAEGAVVTCPTCNVPMQFTLLPAPGQGAAPLPVAEGQPRPEPRRPSAAEKGHQIMDMLGWVFRYRVLVSAVVVPLLAVGGFFGVQLQGGESLKSRYEQLQVGMDVDTVEEVLNPPRSSRRMPTSRLRSFDNVPDVGPYTVSYTEGDGATLTLEFRDAVLVAKSQQGLN